MDSGNKSYTEIAVTECRTINSKSGKVPKTPSLVSSLGIVGSKRIAAAFELDRNNVQYRPGNKVPISGCYVFEMSNFVGEGLEGAG